MQGFNRYIPPDYDPKANSTLNSHQGKKHALGVRAKNIDKGILVVRFELPFNIWCGTCNAHIGAGVRYNAQKRKVGAYFSTPIYAFRCKCHLCSGWFEIRTDPKNAAYVVEEGARKKDEDWNPEENGGFAVHDTEAPSAAEPPADPFAHIEKTIDQQTWAKTKTSRITQLSQASDRISSDPYLVSSAIRRRFREEKKVLLEKQGRDDEIKERYGLQGDVDLGVEDVELGREKWEAGRERRGFLLDVGEGSSGGDSVRAVRDTPQVRTNGKGKTEEKRGSESLAKVLRQTTARKYDPFGGALDVLTGGSLGVGTGGTSQLKIKGKIKDPAVLEKLTGGVKSSKEEHSAPVGLPGGFLAGYGSD